MPTCPMYLSHNPERTSSRSIRIKAQIFTLDRPSSSHGFPFELSLQSGPQEWQHDHCQALFRHPEVVCPKGHLALNTGCDDFKK